ncbi:MAG: hypothetical protein ACRD1R_00305 [Acidobacteriota bacterium]
MNPQIIDLLIVIFLLAGTARAEIYLRWTQDAVLPQSSLQTRNLVVPWRQGAASVIERAALEGYSVYCEITSENAGAAAASLDSGAAGLAVSFDGRTIDQPNAVKQKVAQNSPMLLLNSGGKWPHIRSNMVVKSEGVLRVSSRTSQPWLENNAAWVRIAQTVGPDLAPILTYSWDPINPIEDQQGARVEDYLLAIAEAGALGAGLVLNLDERFQKDLLLGKPRARSSWQELLEYTTFYAWGVRRYEPVSNVGVVTSNHFIWFEVMNLLARHNVPFRLIPPDQLDRDSIEDLDLLIFLDPLEEDPARAAAEFARAGKISVVAAPGENLPWQDSRKDEGEKWISYAQGKGSVIELKEGIVDPDTFALDIRRILGEERRILDIWNGITVLAGLYREPQGSGQLLHLLNYSHHPLSVQVRVKGTFTIVQFESPERPSELLPYEHRNGFTEFTIPWLRIGGRVFLDSK